MKKMKNVKRMLSLLLAMMMALSVISVSAEELTDSTASVPETQPGVVGENKVNVTVTKGSTYTITIPKVVILDGHSDTATGKYAVSVSGDLSGTEAIIVIPDASFKLSQAGKADLTATIEQLKTEWAYGNLDDAEGTITATGLSAGSWSGNFKFNISRGANSAVVTMLEGDGQVVNKFAFPEVRFRSSAPMDTLNEVKINGEVVDPDNYIVTEGSTIITLKNDYVQSLDITKDEPYTIEIVSEKGTADGDFTVVNLIPDGGRYVDVDGNEYTAEQDDYFPDEVQIGDMYYYGDYVYKYGDVWCDSDEDWNSNCNCYQPDEHWGLHVADNTYVEYELPLTQINGDYISDWTCAFSGCVNLENIPTIPNYVTNLTYAFANCVSLVDLSNLVIPNSVTNMNGVFSGCTALTIAPKLPNKVTDTTSAFHSCKNLTQAPSIPDSVTDASYMFCGCTSLTEAPVLPNNIENISGIFRVCTNLKTYVESQDGDGDFSNYVIPNSVTNMYGTFYNCDSLVISPIIPSGVQDMSDTFYGCTSLTGTVEINTNTNMCSGCFAGTIQPIALTGSCTKLADFAATANNNNVTIAQ